MEKRQGPVIAIVGRPNVGKSRLFNRLVGRRAAIVEDQPGVTRDRQYGLCEFAGRRVTVLDTGGLDPAARQGIPAQVREQTRRAVEEAALLLFLMDGREGLTGVDEKIAQLLRSVPKPVFYVVNKIDGPKDEGRLYEFYRLGMQALHPVSAEHGYGVAELLEAVFKALPGPTPSEAEPEAYPKIAVMGRPNVGKSTLINTLLGEERLLTNAEPGTTRDAIDTLLEYGGKGYVFVDTAGVRRRGRIERGVERWSVARSLGSLERCNLALLLLDGVEGVVDQDTKLAGQILKAGRACLLLVNKWDLRKGEKGAMEKFRTDLGRQFAFFPHAPVLFFSALSGKGFPRLFSLVDEVLRAYARRIPTGELNRFLEKVMRQKAPPSHRGRPVRLYYLTQAGTQPPTFVAFSNDPAGVSSSYLKYLENNLRRDYGFSGVPLRLRLRKKR